MNDVSRQNPFAPAAGAQQALANVEAQRGVAEVQARMVIARANPRDQRQAMDAILQDCMRVSLAQGALYEYARGGTEISGPSIRLMETIARRWGNIASGVREVSRRDGYSECVAYAWDLESNYLDERQFQVRHWRDRASGQGYRITDERDIYEMIANVGQRRKRAALQTVIPGDVIEAATEQCEMTLRTQADTSPDAIKKLVAAFAERGVTREQIERRIQRRLDSIRPAQILHLRKIWTSLRDEMSEVTDWFPNAPPRPSAVPEPPTSPTPVRSLIEETTTVSYVANTTGIDRENDYQGAETDGTEELGPYACIDNNGVIWHHGIEIVEEFLMDTFTSAQKRGPKAVEAVIENNEATVEQIRADGHGEVANRLSLEIAQMRRMMRAIPDHPLPAEPGSSSEGNAGLAAGGRSRSGARGEDDGQRRASAAEAGGSPAAVGVGFRGVATVPPPAPPAEPEYIVPPVHDRDGKIAYRAWWTAAFLPKLRQARDKEEFTAYIADNGELMQGYYATCTPMGRITAGKELDEIAQGLPP